MEIIKKQTAKERLIRGFTDPLYFAKEFLEMDLHAQQKECIRLSHMKQEFFLHSGNRWGKTELVLFKGCFNAFYKPVSKAFKHKELDMINAAPSQDQAAICFKKFTSTMQKKKNFSWLIKDIKLSPFPVINFGNKVSWSFRNASRDGRNLEGNSYFFFNFDEFDLQPRAPTLADDLVRPRVWDYGGFISYTTTPRRGKKNSYKLLDALRKKKNAGDNTIAIYNGDSRQNKFLHPSALDKMNSLPPRLFNKNVLGLFEDSEGVITNDMVDFAESASSGIATGPSPGKRYVHAFDLARSSTWLVGVTIEVGDILQIKSWERYKEFTERNAQYWKNVETKIRARVKKWGGILVLDRTGLGDVVWSYLSDLNPIGINLATAHGKLEQDIISEGLSHFETGKIGVPPDIEQITEPDNELWTLRDELTDFSPDNKDNIIWDFVCALFLGIWVARGHAKPENNEPKPRPAVPMVAGSPRR